MSGPESISMSDPKLVGRFAVLFRNDVKTPAKIIRVDMEKERLTYELVGGIDKGKTFTSKFDKAQTAVVYDWDTLNLALLET